MPRPPRLVVPEIALHLIQRGNNRTATFRDAGDFDTYRDLLLRSSRRSRCAIHAYVMMTNHVHLLATPSDGAGPARMMHLLSCAYSTYFNRRYARTGTLWEGRYRSSLVDSDRYLFVCSRYIELNPVRAALVDHPAEYEWSSYRCNAEGQPDALVTPHLLYHALGSQPVARRSAYRDLFGDTQKPDVVQRIRNAVERGAPLGDVPFLERLSVSVHPRRLPLSHGGDRRRGSGSS